MSFPASNPYAPAQGPPPRRDPSRVEATAGQRLAGLLLVVNALLILVGAALSLRAPQAATGPLPPGVGVVPAVIDMAIGASLLSGSGRLALWATVRVVVGMVVFTALQIKSPVAVVIQILVAGSFLLLLLGDAGKPRIGAGGSLFGLYALVEVVSLVAPRLGGRFLHTTGTANGVDAEFYYAVVTEGDRAFQVVGFADRAGFASVEKELRQILGSFRLPAAGATARPAAGR